MAINDPCRVICKSHNGLGVIYLYRDLVIWKRGMDSECQREIGQIETSPAQISAKRAIYS